MTNPPKPPGGSDLGPIPDPSSQKVTPDAGQPPVEPKPEPVEPAGEAQPQDGKGNQPPPPRIAAGSWPPIDCSKPREEVEKAITECMKTKYGEALVSDMNDAQILLSYVTRNALQEDKKLSDEAIQTLIAARERMRSGVFDAATEEGKFRKNYGIVAKAAEPVTVASLRDSLTVAPYRRWLVMKPELRPIAEITCLRYRNYALLVLLALLVSQIYWTISSSVLNKTDVLISEINKAPTKAVYLAQEAARQSALRAAGQTNPAESPASKTSQPPTVVTESKAEKSQLTLDELVTKIGELNASYLMLSKFMARFSALFFERETYTVATEDKDKSKQTKDTASRNPDDIFIPSTFQTQSATVRAVAGQVIDVMQKWLLPLLYGALGAMVFVVRTLSLQARDRIFRKEALVSLVLRVYLGMISGLAIGWFWSQNPQPATTAAGPMSLSTLSPFALAFVAGYGVELFFTLLDKIISTFANKP
jgi:hypothetical protein